MNTTSLAPHMNRYTKKLNPNASTVYLLLILSVSVITCFTGSESVIAGEGNIVISENDAFFQLTANEQPLDAIVDALSDYIDIPIITINNFGYMVNVHLKNLTFEELIGRLLKNHADYALHYSEGELIRILINPFSPENRMVNSKITNVETHDINLIIKDLNGSDIPKRIEAIETLSEIKTNKSVSLLIDQLQDSNKTIRVEAIQALNEVGWTKAIEPLLQMLGDHEALVRAAALDALGELGGEKEMDAVSEMLNDVDADVRETARQALIDLSFE